MTAILLRIAGILVCFIVAMLGLIFVIHGMQLGIDSSIILAYHLCYTCDIFDTPYNLC